MFIANCLLKWKQKRTFRLDLRNHCFTMLVNVNSMRIKCHSHCAESFTLNSIVNLCLNTKMISDYNYNDFL